MQALRLVVGLGNPGPEYEHTRHNAGFWFLERLAGQLGATLRSEPRFHGRVARAGDLWLLAPTTFMNHSGRAVAALTRFYQITPEQILVVYDELDLPPGEARLKLAGGHGGHNGMRDILAHLANAPFPRLRLGIGHPGERNRVVDYVLHAPSKEEAALIGEAIERSLEVWPALAAGRLDAAMLKLHTRKPAPGPAPAPNGKPQS